MLPDPAPARPEGEVRPARTPDLRRLTALWTGLAEQHAALDPSFSVRAGAAAEVRGMLADLLREPDAALLVFERSGEVLGFCSVRIDLAPPIASERARAEITDIAVRPEQRRLGIGRLLVREALSWARARGVRRVEVRVAALNAGAQAFWRAQGFGDLVDVLHRRL